MSTLKIRDANSSTSTSMTTKKKVDELFRRLLPHSLVQSTEKLLAMLQIAPKLFVNGEELVPQTPSAPTVALAATMSKTRSKQRLTSNTAAWRFKPDVGRFRYGLSLQYTPSDSELTLSSLKDAQVTLTSTIMSMPRSLSISNVNALSSKDWRLIVETDRRIGLALYEVTLGDWQASSLIALVWTQRREIARIFLQLHIPELLYSAPQRTRRIRRDDDLDHTHGLHSYTAAISLRSLDELFWEREVYQVEFPSPMTGSQSVAVQLLDNVHGGTAASRDRVLTSEIEPGLGLETEAIKHAMTNCLLVDFTLWDSDCVPVWGFTRALETKAVPSQRETHDDDSNIDLSISSAGGTTKRLEMQYQDGTCGNKLVVHLSKLLPSSATSLIPTKKTKTWVSQIVLTLNLEFINTTFGTNY